MYIFVPTWFTVSDKSPMPIVGTRFTASCAIYRFPPKSYETAKG